MTLLKKCSSVTCASISSRPKRSSLASLWPNIRRTSSWQLWQVGLSPHSLLAQTIREEILAKLRPAQAPSKAMKASPKSLINCSSFKVAYRQFIILNARTRLQMNSNRGRRQHQSLARLAVSCCNEAQIPTMGPAEMAMEATRSLQSLIISAL